MSKKNIIICPVCKEITSLYSKFKNANYYKCNHCTTIFQHPLPTLKDMNIYADHEYSSGLYNQYVKASKLKSATFKERVKNIFQNYNEKKSDIKNLQLLDLGCSCGYFIEAALNQGINAYGVEFSEVAIKSAHENIRSRIIHGDVNKLDILSNSSYDVITAFDILEHTLDPSLFINNAKKHLKKNGLLVISTPDTGHFLRFLMGNKWPMLQPYQHTFLFSKIGLTILLKQAGFSSIKFMPAKKQITLDYIMGQIQIFLPGLYKFYKKISVIIPPPIKNSAFSINIGEIMVFAKSE